MPGLSSLERQDRDSLERHDRTDLDAGQVHVADDDEDAVDPVDVVVPDVLMSMEYLDSMLEHSGDLLYARDRAGRFLLANQAFAETLGLQSGEIVGHLADTGQEPLVTCEFGEPLRRLTSIMCVSSSQSETS